MNASNASLVWEILFWTSAGLLLYAYVGYPLLLAALVPFRKPREEPAEYLPTVSVLIAAYNEEVCIGEKIRQTLECDYPPDKLEIVVVSDGSSDRTDEIVRSYAEKDPSVRLLRIPERRGKTHAQNEGVKLCCGEIVVFSDATTQYHAQAIRHLVASYADPTVGAVTGRFEYCDPAGESTTDVGTAAFWRYETIIKKLQSRILTLTGCSGCIYSLRRDLYEALDDWACSDLEEPLTVVRRGYRVHFARQALAFEHATRCDAEEFRMRVRVVARGMRGILRARELLKFWRYEWVSFQLISHKILRWLAPVFLLGLFASSLALFDHPLYRAVFLAQAGFYLLALITLVLGVHRYWKPLGLPVYFCTLNAASMLALIQVLRGKQYVVWETQRRRTPC